MSEYNVYSESQIADMLYDYMVKCPDLDSLAKDMQMVARFLQKQGVIKIIKDGEHDKI